MNIESVVSIIVVLFTCAFLFSKWRFTYWQRRNVYTVPPSIPFGNFQQLFLGKLDLAEQCNQLYKQIRNKGLAYGGVYMVYKPMLFVVGLDFLKTIFTKDFQSFTDHNNYVNEEADPLTGHLFALKGAKWKALRIKLTPTFTSGKLKMMFDTLLDCTKHLPNILDEHIAKSKPLDIKETFARYTTDVVGSVAFGIDCNCLQNPDTEFRKYGRRLFEMNTLEVAKQLLSMILPSVFEFFSLTVTNKEVGKFFMGIVKETVEYREKHNLDRKDFMKLLIDLKTQNPSPESKNSKDENTYFENGLTFNEIAAQAFVFFAAGFETSSTTLTFCMLELAMQPEIQEKLQTEINDVLETHNGKITYDGIMEMGYLDKCVQETLRKYPPAPALSRECTKTYKIPDSDIVIEKGTPVFVSVYGIHHDPELYTDPEKFDPERFSEENRSKRHSFAFIPFGEGPRICIGMRFGLLQVKVGLVALLRNYRFTLNEKTKTPITYDPKQFILSVQGNVWLNAEKV